MYHVHTISIIAQKMAQYFFGNFEAIDYEKSFILLWGKKSGGGIQIIHG